MKEMMIVFGVINLVWAIAALIVFPEFHSGQVLMAEQLNYALSHATEIAVVISTSVAFILHGVKK